MSNLDIPGVISFARVWRRLNRRGATPIPVLHTDGPSHHLAFAYGGYIDPENGGVVGVTDDYPPFLTRRFEVWAHKATSTVVVWCISPITGDFISRVALELHDTQRRNEALLFELLNKMLMDARYGDLPVWNPR